MKNLFIHICLLSIIISTMQSCAKRKSIRVEYDEVKSTKRIIKNFNYFKVLEKRTPLFAVKQTILKELKPNNEITYTVYDNLLMSPQALNLENQLFLILGEEIIPIDIDELQIEHSSKIKEDTGTILAADSTKVSIVKGYSQENRKYYKISYQLNTEIIEKISQSNEIFFRYYCGPSMLTTALKDNKLAKLKKMIAME